MKRLLILGAGSMQLPVIKKAKELGLYTLVADYDPNAVGFQYADQVAIISTNDLDAILSFAKEQQIDGILTTSDYPVNTVAYVGSQLALPAMSMDVAKICTNKYLQRELFRTASIKTPFYQLCHDTTDMTVFADFPYIVKPVDSSASRGVKKVENKEQLVQAFQEALYYSNKKEVLIESYIEGREFSVETFTQNQKTTIVSITEKLTRGEELGCFVEDTHIEPARITAEENDLISAEVLSAITAIGLDNCPSHTEVKLNSKGVYVIELACRLGGDYITSDLVPLSTGIDMLGNLIRLSVGERIDVKPSISKFSCVQFLNDENYYLCTNLIETGNKNIKRYEVYPYSDKPIHNSLDRLGFIIFQTETQQELENLLNQLR